MLSTTAVNNNQISAVTSKPRTDTTPTKTTEHSSPRVAVDFSSASFVKKATGGSNTAVLATIGDKNFRVKDVGNGYPSIDSRNYQVCIEVIMGNVFRAAGCGAPPMTVAENCHNLFNETENGNFYVASEVMDGFKDFGDFLRSDPSYKSYVNNTKTYEDERLRCEDAEKKKKEICPDGKYWLINDASKIKEYAQADGEHFRGLSELGRLVDPHIRRELCKHLYMNIYLANWDPMNERMHNAGNMHGQWMSCDFGQSGPIGFGGKPKDESKQLAIDQRQKSQFQPEGFGTDTNFLSFDKKITRDSFNPNKLPYGFAFDFLKEELEDSGLRCEVIFQIKCLSDEAISFIVESHYSPPDPHSCFKWPTKSEIIDTLIARRDSIVEVFQDELEAWQAANPAKADKLVAHGKNILDSLRDE